MPILGEGEYHTSSIKMMDGALSRAISKRFEAARREKKSHVRELGILIGENQLAYHSPPPARIYMAPPSGLGTRGRVIYEKGHTKGGVVFNSKGGETAPQQSLDVNYPLRPPHFFKKYPGEI